MGARVWHISGEASSAGQRRMAGFLRATGARPGDRVAFTARPAPPVVAAVLGAARIGVVPVMVNSGLLDHEKRGILDDAAPSITFASPEDVDRALAEADQAHDLSPVPLVRPMHYTSGTTGTPKGVWSGVLDGADAEALFADEREQWRFAPDDRVLVCSPLHHSAAVRFLSTCLLSGGDAVLVDRFDAATVLDAIEAHRPTVAFMVPSQLHRLFEHGAGRRDLASIRLLAHAGEPCPPSLKERAFETFPPGSVWEFYGSTEGQFTVCSPEDWQARPGTVGRARPHRVLAVDGGGQIWCGVPTWARFEYWGDPDKTAAAWRGDSFTVGDLGRLDGDGFLYIDGRRDDLIISGGVNVYPAEVEAALSSMPGIGAVAAFGVPDERWGQRVCVAVTGPVSEGDVQRHAAATLAGYKRPKDVYHLAELPRTATGKVRRSAIAELLGLG